jgi:Cu+-exporting ATPase
MSGRTAPFLDSGGAAPGASGCRHCGDPCDRDAITTGAGTFCCQGCATVFELLASHDLTGFYTCDVRPGRSQRDAARRPADRFAVLDDPRVAARFLSNAGHGRLRATFSTPSIHCASCLWVLEQLWRFDEGIGRSEADVLARVVRVDFDPARTSLRAVAERLAALGYEPVLDAERDAGAAPADRRRLYLKIGIAGFAFGNVMLFSIPRYVNGAPLEPAFERLFGTLNLLFALPVLLYSASDYFRGAWQAARGRTVTLDVPIALGLAVLFGRSAVEIAFGLGEGFLDSFAGLVFFLLIGRAFQQHVFDRIAFDRTMRSFLPLSVHVERSDGTALIPLEQLRPDDTVVLRAHEVVPADGTLIDDHAELDYAFVTGEQVPITLHRGEPVMAGGRVAGRAVRVRLTSAVSHSALARLWANPVFDRPKPSWLQTLLARFGFWFTVAAILLATAGAIAWWPDARRAAEVATAVLIIACPCAFTLAAPITLGTAMSVLARAGLYLKRPAVALDLSRIDSIVFDKTGTLTRREPSSHPGLATLPAADAALVRRLATHSVHPVSRAIAGGQVGDAGTTAVREVRGQGVAGRVDGHTVRVGSAAFIAAETGRELADVAGVTWAAVDDGTPAAISVAGAERAGIADTATTLSARHDLWLVSGDHETAAARWAPVFGDRMLFRQSPEDKLAVVEALQVDDRRVLMVGDGLNDAGALAAADVGLAVSDDTACLVPACDAVVAGDRLVDLPVFLGYARRARRVIALCFTISIAYNAIGLALALSGQLTPLATAILMPVSSLTIVGLSVGLMRARTERMTRS